METRGRLGAFALTFVFFAVGQAHGQETTESVASFAGVWDLPGTTTNIEINADNSVRHSQFGAGVIKHEVGDYFTVFYNQQQNPLQCYYQIKKYSENELSVVKALKTDSVDCELGMLRRAPGTLSESQGSDKESHGMKKNESEDQRPPSNAGPPGSMSKTADKERERESPPSAMPPTAAEELSFLPTRVFKDCGSCPDMVVVPAGEFDMGSPDGELGRLAIEGPRHRVSFARPFAVGRYAITRDEFNAFVTASGYQYGTSCYADAGDRWVELQNASFLSPPGFTQEGRHPAVCVSWKDANEYVKWLSAQTKKNYRLLTEAEREYVARAGTSTPYWWGEAMTPEHANYDKRMHPASVDRLKPSENQTPGHTMAVDAFAPNAWGIYQVHGNVAEWVQDCWNSRYIGAPTDGSAAEVGDCSRRMIRGGGWNHWAEDTRAAYREAVPLDHRYYEVGFRVARDLGK